MSNPTSSLKKVKKAPLFLPEMAKSINQFSPSPSLYDDEAAAKGENSHEVFDTGRKDRLELKELNSNRSPRSTNSFNMGYPKSSLTPLSHRTSNLNKHSLLGDIPSNQVPFKTKIDDSDLIDEFTTKMAVNNMKRNMTQNKTVDKPPTDMDLMQVMMSKIKNTEAKCALLERENREKDRKIQILQEKLDLYSRKNLEQNSTRDDLIEELEEKNIKLEQKIIEMENFLADYGLYWVGGNKVTSENNRPTSDQLQKQGFACDFDLFVKNVNELNSLVENNNEKKIVQFKNNSVKFETSESVKLTLYSNGIVLYEGPFRPFTDSLTRKFCIDIMDGYFPSELESKYPDGVRLELVDKRDILFKQKEINSVFKSKGYRLGSGNDIEQNHPQITFKENSSELLSQFESSKNIETQLTENPLTVEQFLNKLPNSVVRNGKLINIKNDLSSLINGTELKHSNASTTTKTLPTTTTTSTATNTTNMTVENENNNHDLKNQVELGERENNNNKVITNGSCVAVVNGDDRSALKATLKIKTLNNSEATYLVNMSYTDTIQKLKDHIKSLRRAKHLYNDFDLASVCPRKIFDNPKLTLEQCDLVPNSNVILIPKKK